jgi:hypothetical protein
MQPKTLKGGIEVEDPRVFHFRPLRQQPEEQQQLAGIYSRARHKRGEDGKKKKQTGTQPRSFGFVCKRARHPSSWALPSCHTHTSLQRADAIISRLNLFVCFYLSPSYYVYIRICTMGVSFGAGHACLCRRMSSPLRRVKIIQYLRLNTFKQK